MIDLQNSSNKTIKTIIILLGIISFIGIAGYGLSYILKMPDISPEKFIPNTIDNSEKTDFGFGNILAVFIVIYAFAFLPIVIMFSTIKYKTNPFAIIIACSLIVVSLLLEIINNLPLIGLALVHVNTDSISPEILLYMRQTETIRYLAFDVAGFTFLYIGFFIFAIIFYRTNRLLTYIIVGSILFFMANVPFLWIDPKIAILIMAISIFAFALVPFLLVRMILNQYKIQIK